MAYTIEDSYKPLSFQELATPYMMYKDAYDKQQANLENLYDKTNVFSDLDDLPEDSKARKIYDNYMNDLNKANNDFATNGLTMNNRGLYDNIRRRYQGEIGRLEQAKTKADEINKLRMTQSMQDPSMLYAQSNISIDDLLGNNKPNMYGISGRYLYDLGSKAGATSSSRIWSDVNVKNTANKWYLIASQSNGYTPEMLARMRDDFMSIPEFRKQVENAMQANGVTKNLTGDKYTQAALNYVNGFIDSCTYKRNDNLQQNPEIEFGEKVREYNNTYALQKQQEEDQLHTQGLYRDKKGNIYYDSTKDPQLQKAKAIAAIKAAGKGKGNGNDNGNGNSNGNSSSYASQAPYGIKITYDKNVTGQYKSEIINADVRGNFKNPNGNIYAFYELPKSAQTKLKTAYIGDGDPYQYRYYWDKDDASVVALPADRKKGISDTSDLDEALQNLSHTSTN